MPPLATLLLLAAASGMTNGWAIVDPVAAPTGEVIGAIGLGAMLAAPMPTSPPKPDLKRLLKRQSLADPRTCGFVDQDISMLMRLILSTSDSDCSADNPVTCSVGRICTTSGASNVGCCAATAPMASCTQITSCIPNASTASYAVSFLARDDVIGW